MIEITTTETSVIIKHESLTKTYPKNAVRFNVQGDKILFADTPTNRDVLTIKIDKVSVNGEALTGDTIEVATKLSKEIYNAIDNIQIGGRNLLLNSNKLRLSRSHELLDEYQGVKNVIKVVNPEAATYFNPIEQLSEPLKPNETYTLSVLFTYIGNNIGSRQLYMGSYQNTMGEIEEGKFRRIYITFTRATYHRIHMNFSGFDTIYLAEWKLEKGNKATDWTPAPEDIQDGISKVQADAEDAQSEIDKAQTPANNANEYINNVLKDELESIKNQIIYNKSYKGEKA